jgi:hypothetical protein
MGFIDCAVWFQQNCHTKIQSPSIFQKPSMPPRIFHAAPGSIRPASRTGIAPWRHAYLKI